MVVQWQQKGEPSQRHQNQDNETKLEINLLQDLPHQKRSLVQGKSIWKKDSQMLSVFSTSMRRLVI